MVLSRQTIQKLINEGKLVINPFDEKYLGSCSYDLHLGENIVYPDTGKEERMLKDFYLLPNNLVLINTQEYLELPGYLVGHFSTRSNAARLGLLVNFGSELIQPNTKGKLTLEIKNLSNKEVILSKNISLTQIYFEKLDLIVNEVRRSYNTEKKIGISNLCEEIRDC